MENSKRGLVRLTEKLPFIDGLELGSVFLTPMEQEENSYLVVIGTYNQKNTQKPYVY